MNDNQIKVLDAAMELIGIAIPAASPLYKGARALMALRDKTIEDDLTDEDLAVISSNHDDNIDDLQDAIEDMDTRI